MLLLHDGVQPIQIRKVRDIPLHPGDMVANLLDCCIQFTLTATSDIDIGALRNEALCRGETYAAAATGNEGPLPVEYIGHLNWGMTSVPMSSMVRITVSWGIFQGLTRQSRRSTPPAS